MQACVGNAAQAGILLERAAGAFDAAGMVVLAACARARRARLRRDAGAEAATIGTLAACGIRRPEHWLAMLAPGFPGV
jgi:hypothetical protein